jgi:hypothetical protein
MKATNKQITFFKAKILEPIHTQVVAIGNYKAKEDVNEMLKDFAGLPMDLSCAKMTKEEISELIVHSFSFGDMIGLSLNYPNNECDWND